MVHSEQLSTHLFEDVSVRVTDQRMANDSSSRKEPKLPFDRDTYTHFSNRMSMMWTLSLEREICDHHFFSGDQLKSDKGVMERVALHNPHSAMLFGFNS